MTGKKKKNENIEQQIEDLEDEVLQEEAEVEMTIEQERDDLLGRLQRLAADYQNYQKRVQKDIAHAREFGNESLMKELLGVLDDMERAMAAANDAEKDDPFFAGMKMVHDNLLAVLGKYGLQPIQAEGQPFDPEKHSAMMQQPTNEVAPMTVLQEVQKGYTLKGRTLRPAGVVVSKAQEE